jgi:DNA-directed RNA polymerase subunit RPC12/RpoP
MDKIKKAGSKKKVDASMQCPYCKTYKVLSRRVTYKSKNKIPDKKVPISRTYRCSECGKNFTINLSTKDIRIIIMSDTHCGHITGLTPPPWQQTNNDKFSQFQKETWEWFCNTIDQHKPFDILIANGDLIDGRQEKQGGDELITGSRIEQVKMAAEVLERTGAYKKYLTRGTPYHVGKLEQWEDIIAENVKGIIKNNLYLNINGCIFDVRHKTGRSNIPHGRFTQMARAAMWNDLINASNGKKANVIIRSHVHYSIYGGHNNNSLFFTTCCLQGNSNYGQKECEGNIDYGFHIIDIDNNGLITNFKTFQPEFTVDFNEILEIV